MERGTTATQSKCALERPRTPQLPIFLPAGQVPLAELQRKRGVDRVESGNARRSIGEIEFRASPSGVIDQWHAERGRSLSRRHAEGEGNGVGLEPAIGRPAP